MPAPLPSELARWLPKHVVVLAECEGGGVVAFDFEPQEKESPSTMVRLLSGASAPGQFGVQRLRHLPSGAVRLGFVAPNVAVEDVAVALNGRFDRNLSLSGNDCNAYARAVLEVLLDRPDNATGRRLYSTLDGEALDARDEVVYKEPSLVGAVVLVAGTTVGAGILALPATTQPVGFVPSTVALLLCWLYMATTGLLIAEVALADMASSGKRATSLQSMAATTIGPIGAAVSSLSFVVVHCGLLVAYLSRGGELLASLLPGLSVGLPPPALFAAVFGGLVFLTRGSDALEAANNLFAAVVLVSFVALLSLVVPLADLGRLSAVADWSHTSDIIPTMLLSLVYHNVVPTICAQLEGDRGKITTAIVVGSLVPCLMFVAWNAAILAAAPPGAADPLEALRSSGGALLALGVLAFSLSAIVTSFIGFVLSLTDFFADAFGTADKETPMTKIRDFALTLLPPLAVACYDPSLFFVAIDKAGAFGVSLLFGFLPAWMALAQRASDLPVLVRTPGFLGGYVRGPLTPGGLLSLAVVAAIALAVVADNALELLG